MDSADNNDRWLVSYADFITLLFAFFVVMYSISSVNEAKYRSLTHSLGTAFSKKNQPTSGDVADPLQLRTPPVVTQAIPPEQPPEHVGPGKPSDRPQTAQTTLLDNPTDEEIEKRRQLSEALLKERRQLKAASEQLQTALSPYIDIDMVSVVSYDYWVSVEMSSALLFASGDVELSPEALPVLKKVAEVIATMQNAINVEGHTDNVPIANQKFRSNWDLSAARASSVVQEFAKLGIDPSRLSAIGYSAYHPVADNDSEEGRFKNRRVLLVLMSQALSRYGTSDEERAKLLNMEPVDDTVAPIVTPPPSSTSNNAPQ